MPTVGGGGSETDGFPELARLLWSSVTLSGPVPETVLTGWQHALATLLREAARGVGLVRHSSLDLPVEAWDPDLLASLSHLAVRRGPFLMLARHAADAGTVHAFFGKRIQRLRQETPGHRHPAPNLRSWLDRILPREILAGTDGNPGFDNAQQRLAVAHGVDAPATLLTGGPGTGKTSTAAALLALAHCLDPSLQPDDILVAAPTGKAACRVADSLRNAGQRFSGIPEKTRAFLQGLRATTLHHALEWSPIPPEQGGPFRRTAMNPLSARWVLVDEASMVDLSLMAALVEAMPENAPLLLLGDADQLESVEVGGILADLVRRASREGASAAPDFTELGARLGSDPQEVRQWWLDGLPAQTHDEPTDPSPGLEGLVIGLKDSRRALHAPWILELARRVRPGESQADAVGAVRSFFDGLKPPASDAVRWHRHPSPATLDALCRPYWIQWARQRSEWCLGGMDGTGEELNEDVARSALALLGHFQLLCSTNAQVEAANARGWEMLTGQRPSSIRLLPHGCPFLLLANLRDLGLSNGDVGIALGPSPSGTATRALFAGLDGCPRYVPLARLPAVKPAFALTIHKSQGSEWPHVAIELPPRPGSRVVSRRLLYTAITRSSQAMDLIGSEPVLADILG